MSQANHPPAITSPAMAAVDDDSAGSVYQLTAMDADGHALTFSISGGADQGAVRITASGALSFAEPANFEAPADSNHDNVYHVMLAVSDGIATTILDLTLTVRDVPVPMEAAPAWTFLGNAPWPPRDSAGEAVLNNQLYIMGGWYDSFQPTLRDVWSSGGGAAWTQVTAQAPWTHSDWPMSIAFNGRLWMMGGYDLGRLPGATPSNQVWSSADGANWTLEAVAPWSARLAGEVVVLNNRLYLLGGLERAIDGTPADLRNDVWVTDDGRNWTELRRSADWAPRAYHNALAYNGRIWLFGGGNYAPVYEQRNDVWSSADGIEWRRETARAEWLPRIFASAVVYRGRMWLLGGNGRTSPQDPATVFNLNDVWTSTDGARWTRIQSPAIWTARDAVSAWVLNDRIYIGGGFAPGGVLSSEMWSLQLP
jgi:N-acetylneuraminic acid mutarotase